MTGSTNTARGGRGQGLFHRVLLVAGLIVAGGVCAAAAPSDPAPFPVPANLEVPEGHRVSLVTHAVGTQNYICLGAGMSWTFIGPQATVFDEAGELALTHYLSPNPYEGGVARATWLHKDGSGAWALAIASSTDPAYVASGSVPWLLLSVVGSQGSAGADKVEATTFIQRVNTVGGVAPAGGCPSAGARAFVPYETDYVFYQAR